MASERIQELVPELDDRIRQKFGNGDVPGLAVGVVAGDGLAWFAGYGARDVDTGAAPDERTLSRVASVTKTFTATAIMQLRDAGLLALDDPLLVHIPEFTIVNARHGSLEGVTLRRLMTHHSGLATEPPTLRWDEPSFPSAAEIIDSLADTEVVIPQDFQWKYSNLAYALLGMVIERVTGRPYADYLQGEILTPLGLKHTALELGPSLRAQLAVGYSPAREGGGFRKAPYMSLNGMSPCGQLHSNVHDLAKWVVFQFEGRLDGRSTVLSTATLEEMHRPQYLDPGWKSGQGLGWRVQRLDSDVFNLHGGGIHGFSSNVVFHRPTKTGVIVLANLWPVTWPYELAMDLAQVVASGHSHRGPESQSTPAPAFQEFSGKYWAEPGISVTVEIRGDALHIPLPKPGEYLLHRPATMDREDGDVFRVREGRAAGERAVFYRSDDGSISGFRLGGFFYERQD